MKAPGDSNSDFSQTYKWYSLGVLMLVFASNFLDRQILGVLLQPIKEDLGLSDSQLGLISGIGFAFFYATMGIPLARWADRHSRVSLISAAALVWSGMTALCGMAGNFTQLLLLRVGVGVGEAGCTPPAHSLIADYFAPETRVRAMAVYSLGAPIGVALGYLLGGWVNEFYGWRITFLVVGIPGVLLALLVRLTLREPTRGGSEKVVVSSTEIPTVKEVLFYLWRQPSFRHLSIGTGLLAFTAYGGAAWFPSFLIRSHAMTTGEIGTWLAILSIGGGVTGTFIGGYLGQRLGNRNKAWCAWLPGIAMLVSIPFTLVALLTTSSVWVLGFIIPSIIAPAVHNPPVYATIQGLATLRMRAMATAILFFITNLIGLGLGPLFIGVTSDLLAPEFGEDSLRMALVIGLVFYIWSALHYFLAGRTISKDLQRTADEQMILAERS